MKKLLPLLLVCALLLGFAGCSEHVEKGPFDMEAVERYTYDPNFHGDCFGIHTSERGFEIYLKSVSNVVIAQFKKETKINGQSFFEFEVKETLKGDIPLSTISVVEDSNLSSCICSHGMYYPNCTYVLPLSGCGTYFLRKYDPNNERSIYMENYVHDEFNRLNYFKDFDDYFKRNYGSENIKFDDFNEQGQNTLLEEYNDAVEHDKKVMAFINEALKESKSLPEMISYTATDTESIVNLAETIVKFRVIQPVRYPDKASLLLLCRCKVTKQYKGKKTESEIYVHLSPEDFVNEKSHEYIACLKNNGSSEQEYYYSSVQSVFSIDKEAEIKQILAKQK